MTVLFRGLFILSGLPLVFLTTSAFARGTGNMAVDMIVSAQMLPHSSDVESSPNRGVAVQIHFTGDRSLAGGMDVENEQSGIALEDALVSSDFTDADKAALRNVVVPKRDELVSRLLKVVAEYNKLKSLQQAEDSTLLRDYEAKSEALLVEYQNQIDRALNQQLAQR